MKNGRHSIQLDLLFVFFIVFSHISSIVSVPVIEANMQFAIGSTMLILRASKYGEDVTKLQKPTVNKNLKEWFWERIERDFFPFKSHIVCIVTHHLPWKPIKITCIVHTQTFTWCICRMCQAYAHTSPTHICHNNRRQVFALLFLSSFEIYSSMI